MRGQRLNPDHHTTLLPLRSEHLAASGITVRALHDNNARVRCLRRRDKRPMRYSSLSRANHAWATRSVHARGARCHVLKSGA